MLGPPGFHPGIAVRLFSGVSADSRLPCRSTTVTAREASWAGQVLEDRYEVVELCGRGGMASVYRAFDRRLRTDVAVKVPKLGAPTSVEFSKRFAREVRALCTLHHPHLVRILDVGEHRRTPYFVMPYLSGGSLRQRLGPSTSHYPILATAHGVAFWLPDIAKALDYLHQKRYLHRDVKPENIMFDRDDHVYLGDFGTVKILADLSSDNPDSRITELGQAIGTLPYLAPEVLINGELTGKVDQFALGVTVYEVLSGRLPFRGRTPPQLYLAHQESRPEPLERIADVSPQVAEVVEKALALHPDQRFSCCEEFADAFVKALRCTSV